MPYDWHVKEKKLFVDAITQQVLCPEPLTADLLMHTFQCCCELVSHNGSDEVYTILSDALHMTAKCLIENRSEADSLIRTRRSFDLSVYRLIVATSYWIRWNVRMNPTCQITVLKLADSYWSLVRIKVIRLKLLKSWGLPHDIADFIIHSSLKEYRHTQSTAPSVA